ncbi:hypothetical protein CBS101457_000695 [Exobasidium rhododendri]|nr:hypothetical protein CBS101457_000695 [Exobasidium rhododendri]
MSSAPSAAIDRKEDTLDPVASSSKPWSNQSVLSKPLYAYSLPSELLQNLKLRSIDVQESEEVAPSQTNETDKESKQANSSTNSGKSSAQKTCVVCPKAPEWEGAKQARAHLRSEWHRYNAALTKRNRPEDCLDEDTFHQSIEELSSDGTSSESETENFSERAKAPVDHVAALLGKLTVSSSANAFVASDSEGEETSARAALTAKEPYLWFVTTSFGALHIQQTQFGVLRGVFPEAESDVVPKDWHISTLCQIQAGPLQSQQTPKDLKRFKGGSSANEAASMLAATFIDASGEKPEDDGSSDGGSGEEDSSTEDVTTTTSAMSITSAPSTPSSPLRTWTILLLGGGNFSAVVIALNPREQFISKRKGTTERQFVILARKQFHRYTTRRKQGGAQSAQDASGKFAKSAGAQLRRYGEQALGDEIRALLSTKKWREAIGKSEKVWVRAGLRSARGILWNWVGSEESPLDAMRKDDKVQSLPIATRKPTVGEGLRCFAELTRIRVRHDTEEEMQAKDEAYRAQLENSARSRQEKRNVEKDKLRREAEAKEATLAAKKKAAGLKLDEKEVLRRERFTRLIDMIRKGRIDNTVNHLEKYEKDLLRVTGWDAEDKVVEPDDVDDAMEQSRRRINVILPFWWRYEDAREKGILLHKGEENLTGARPQLLPSTLLQVAAESGHESQVSYFLIERRSDPTIAIRPPPVQHSTIDDAEMLAKFPHRTAYDLCTSRDSRDVFRRLMAAQPDWCKDWSGPDAGGARVSKALTSEMEEAREREEKVRDKRQAVKDKARLRQEEEEKKRAHEIDVAAMKHSAATKPPPPPPSSTSKNRLGGNNTAPRALQNKRDQAAGLSPEVQSRIEREKRARAAEARVKAMQDGRGA